MQEKGSLQRKVVQRFRRSTTQTETMTMQQPWMRLTPVSADVYVKCGSSDPSFADGHREKKMRKKNGNFHKMMQ